MKNVYKCILIGVYIMLFTKNEEKTIRLANYSINLYQQVKFNS